jgi:hypothetical protein
VINLDLRGTGEKLRYGHKYNQDQLPALRRIDSLFRKDYFLAGYLTMVLDDVGIPTSRTLARFPEVDGVAYWTGVEFRLPTWGQIALLLPLGQDLDNGPVVLVDHYTTSVQVVNDLLTKIIETVTEDHIKKYAPKEDELDTKAAQ